MTSTFLYGFFGVVFALAAWVIISHLWERKPRGGVIVNVRPPMLYDEQHIDRPAYLRRDTEEE